MTTGKQLSALLLLTTALTFPGAAFAQGTDGDDQLLDQVEGVDGSEEEYDEPEISIPGGNTIIVTGRINRDPTRNASQVISVLSTEQIARTGEGDIAGALGRVTGISVVEGGLVYVRGLGDRYSLALLNGLPLPSPEPLSRVVPLDIFPTNVVASSLVQKTYSPNYPGEFGGGVINLTTRAIPDETFLTVSGSLSGDTETTFQNGYAYYGSESDWTGFDNGARDLAPSVQSFFTDSLTNGTLIETLDQPTVEGIARHLTPPHLSTNQIIGDLPANFSVGVTAGTAIDVGDDGRLGVVLTTSLKNEWRNREINRQEAGPNSANVSRNENEFNTDNKMLFNALLGIGLELGDHTFRLTNLFIRDTVKQASISDYTRTEFSDFDFLQQNTAWYERQLIDSQLVAELDFGELGVELRGGYARTDREAPYNLTYTYGRDGTPPANAPWRGEYMVDLGRSIGSGFQETGVDVVFSDLNEELWYGGADLSYEFTPSFSATVGYAYTDTARYSERRGFTFDVDVDPAFYVTDPAVDGNGFPANGLNSLQQILEIAGLRSAPLLFNGATYNLFDVGLIDQNVFDPAFEAALTIHGAYAQGQARLLDDRLTIQGGVRYETADQSTTPVGALNVGTPVSKSDEYWLPGGTITFESMEDLQLRFSASRTIARPQFRELVRQRYFDPESNRAYNGNPFLTDSELTNLEGRIEYYLGGQNRISVAGFYKDIKDPIEVYVGLVTGDRFISYANAPSATLWGIEADIQYFVDLYGMGGFFESKQLVMLANYTYTTSELSVGANDLVTVVQGANVISAAAETYFTDGSPLVGQSDHLVNLQFGIEDVDTLQQLTVLVNYASDRVSLRGSNGLSDVIDSPGVTLDLVFRQGLALFGTEAEFKLEARNLLGTDHEETQTNAVGLLINNNTYDIGQSISAGLSITF